MSTNYNNWSQLFATRQQIFAASEIRNAVKFLECTRTPSKGWGLYPGLPSELHQTALAIKALRSLNDPNTKGLIADVATYYKNDKEKTLQQLSLTDLADLLIVVRSETSLDSDYVEKVLNAIKFQYNSLLTNGQTIPLRDLGLLILSVRDLWDHLKEFNSSWLIKLLNSQLPDGSWPASDGNTGCVITTSMIVQVLSELEIQDKEPLQRGLQFLIKFTKEKGRQPSDYIEDTFTTATVLSAISKIPDVPYHLLSDGVNNLLKLKNQDGCWGGGANEPSTVECTSLALLALIDAGENRFVPVRLAEAAFHDVLVGINKISNDLEQLKKDFDGKVQQQIGNVVQERDKLRAENKALKKELRNFEKQAHFFEQVEFADKFSNILKYSENQTIIKDKSSPTRGILNIIHDVINLTNPFIIRNTIVIIALTSITWLFYTIISQIIKNKNQSILQSILQAISPLTTINYLLIIMPVLLITMLLIYLRLLRAKRRFNFDRELFKLERAKIEQIKSGYVLPISVLSDAFINVSRDWPHSIREELIYRLNKEFVELPPDIALRLIESLMNRFKLDFDQKIFLRQWIKLIMDLQVADRRVLFDRLRIIG